MALPKLDTPVYTLELPSTGEEITYRPFLVKEEKILLIAMEEENEFERLAQIQDTEEKADVVRGLAGIIVEDEDESDEMQFFPTPTWDGPSLTVQDIHFNEELNKTQIEELDT